MNTMKNIGVLLSITMVAGMACCYFGPWNSSATCAIAPSTTTVSNMEPEKSNASIATTATTLENWRYTSCTANTRTRSFAARSNTSKYGRAFSGKNSSSTKNRSSRYASSRKYGSRKASSRKYRGRSNRYYASSNSRRRNSGSSGLSRFGNTMSRFLSSMMDASANGFGNTSLSTGAFSFAGQPFYYARFNFTYSMNVFGRSFTFVRSFVLFSSQPGGIRNFLANQFGTTFSNANSNANAFAKVNAISNAGAQASPKTQVTATTSAKATNGAISTKTKVRVNSNARRVNIYVSNITIVTPVIVVQSPSAL